MAFWILMGGPHDLWAQERSCSGQFPASCFDGQLRLRSESWTSPDLGLAGRTATNLLLLRALVGLKVDLHEFFHVRAQWGLAENLTSDPALRPFDVDPYYLQQGFAQLGPLPLAPRTSLSLVLGRQELPLGSSRLLGVREGPNVRLSFDGIRAELSFPQLTIQSFGALEVRVQDGVFDDRSSWSRAIWGLYGTLHPQNVPPEGPHMDVYYLGVKRPAIYRDLAATEVRHSLGSRLFGKLAWFDFNWEMVAQVGTFDRQRISAWTFASDQGASYRIDPVRVRVGLRANATSGDEDGADGRLQTFNPLYPKLPYFSELAILSPMNHRDVHPLLNLEVGAFVDLEAGYIWFAKQLAEDDVYGPSSMPIGGSAATSSRELGQQLNLEAKYRPREGTELCFYYSRFFVGSALEELGARDSSLVLLWSKLTF